MKGALRHWLLETRENGYCLHTQRKNPPLPHTHPYSLVSSGLYQLPWLWQPGLDLPWAPGSGSGQAGSWGSCQERRTQRKLRMVSERTQGSNPDPTISLSTPTLQIRKLRSRAYREFT